MNLERHVAAPMHTGGTGARLFSGTLRIGLLTLVYLAGSLVLGWYSLKLGRAIDFDFKNYHYYTAYSFLTGRFYHDYAAAQLQTFLNPMPFVPFYLLASNFSAKTTGFVMGGLHGLSFGLLFMIALRILSTMPWIPRVLMALGCAAAGVYAPSFMAELGSSGNDHMAGLFVVASVYALVSAIVIHGAADARGARRGVIIGGVLIGIGAGLKLTAVSYLIGAFIALLLTSRSWRSAPVMSMWFSIGSFVGLLLSRGYWMALLWNRFDSPLFPFYNKIFGSPYFFDVNWADRRFMPKTLEEALEMPVLFLSANRITAQGFNFRDSRYAIIAGLIALLLVVLIGRGVWRLVKWFRARGAAEHSGDVMSDRPHTVASGGKPGNDRAAVFLVLMFVASYVLWESRFSIYRYTVSLELLGGVVIAGLITLIVGPWYIRVPMMVAAFVWIQMVMVPGWYPKRMGWTEKYVDVKVPELEKPESTLVILVADRPQSYVIPFFPKETRFIGLWSNYAKRRSTFPGQDHKGVEEMVEIVRAHEGPMYVLSRSAGRASLGRVEKWGVRAVGSAKGPRHKGRRQPVPGGADMSGRWLGSAKAQQNGDQKPTVLRLESNVDGTLYLWPVEIER